MSRIVCYIYLPTYPLALVIWLLRHQLRCFVDLRTSFDILVLLREVTYRSLAIELNRVISVLNSLLKSPIVLPNCHEVRGSPARCSMVATFNKDKSQSCELEKTPRFTSYRYRSTTKSHCLNNITVKGVVSGASEDPITAALW